MKNCLNLSFQKAKASHIQAVYEIEKESIGLWNINQFYDELKFSFSIFIIAIVDDEISAYITAWKVAGELQINSIAVKPSYRKNGIGIKLINEAINLYTEIKPEKIVLEVAESNIEAISFYNKNGFKKTGTRKNFYVNEDAFIMEKILN
jgi:ribosomal-protein-alanine N-acetyltransferase